MAMITIERLLEGKYNNLGWNWRGSCENLIWYGGVHSNGYMSKGRKAKKVKTKRAKTQRAKKRAKIDYSATMVSLTFLSKEKPVTGV